MPQTIQGTARRIASHGRGKDTRLMHITPREEELWRLAGATKNPKTGMLEAGFFDDILSFAGPIASIAFPEAAPFIAGFQGLEGLANGNPLQAISGAFGASGGFGGFGGSGFTGDPGNFSGFEGSGFAGDPGNSFGAPAGGGGSFMPQDFSNTGLGVQFDPATGMPLAPQSNFMGVTSPDFAKSLGDVSGFSFPAGGFGGGTGGGAGAFDQSGVGPELSKTLGLGDGTGGPSGFTSGRFGSTEMQAPGSPYYNMFRLANSAGAMPWGPVTGGINAVSGLLGLNQSRKLLQQGQNADPFGPYRAQYAQQLQNLTNNPSSVTGTPGYQFGMDQGTQAVRRSMAAGGFGGSGNEAIALNKYGQDYASQQYMQQLQMLSQLGGANINPQVGASITGQGNDLLGRSLASLAYGSQRMGA